jgi:hypothetical protein
MKNTPCKVIGLLALAFLAATQAARAQEPLLVNIPFSFTAGKMTLPAGEYQIQKPSDRSLALLIQRTDRKAAMFVTTFAVAANGPQTQSKVVFHRYGSRYFLSRIWVAGYSQGKELPKSAEEKEQALAAHNQPPEQITILARLTPTQP